MPTSTLTANPDLTDEELATKGDLAALYQRYARRVLGFLANQNVPAVEREDLHQETWLRVHKKLQEWTSGGEHSQSRAEHFRGFLFEVARNLAIDWHRKRRPVQLDAEHDRVDSRTPTPAERLADSEHRERFRLCLDKLEESEAALIRGRIEGEDYEFLAARLRMTLKQAYRVFFELKIKLQRCIERPAHEPRHTRPS